MKLSNVLSTGIYCTKNTGLPPGMVLKVILMDVGSETDPGTSVPPCNYGEPRGRETEGKRLGGRKIRPRREGGERRMPSAIQPQNTYLTHFTAGKYHHCPCRIPASPAIFPPFPLSQLSQQSHVINPAQYLTWQRRTPL